jgi:hypothetical protein
MIPARHDSPINTLTISPLLLPWPGYLDDLYSYEPTNMTWTRIYAAPGGGSPPLGRACHGFTSAGGKLYVHGGEGQSGNWNIYNKYYLISPFI